MIETMVQRDSNEMVQHWKLGIQELSNPALSIYYDRISSLKSDFDHEIEKDLERTFPSDYQISRMSNKYRKLLRVLRAVAYHVPQVGYVQGLNFISESLLKVIKDEKIVFWKIIGILNIHETIDMYTEGMP